MTKSANRLLWTLVVIGLAAGGAAFLILPAAPAVPAYAFETDIEPILAKYCYECHGEGADKADIVFDEYEHLDELFDDFALWEGTHNNLEGFLMPPGDDPQPSDEDREKIVAWIEQKVFKLDPKNPDPGRVTIRRLNREEYNNSIRDLVGMDLRPADDFPEDDTGYGFDNIGDVLSLSPALMERYLNASRKIVDAVIVTEAPRPETITVDASKFRGIQRVADGTGSLASNGTVAARFKAPADGEYRIDIFAGGSQSKREWPLMRTKLDQGPQKDFRVNTPRASPHAFSLSFTLKKGREHSVEMSFMNDEYDPKAKDPRQRDRNLYIREVRVTGPMNRPPPEPSEAHKMIFAAGEAEAPEADRARQVVGRFAERAWRRPLKPDETERLMRFYHSTRKEKGNFDQGVKLAIQAVLMSPNFLFRGEVQPDPDNPDEVHPIDEFALATRLSYFLWSSLPDDELFSLARKGKLRKNLDAQIERLLADPRTADSLTRNFAGQWLQLRNLRLSSPDTKSFPAWNEKLRDAMREETERTFAAIVKENRSVLEFLDADHTFVNELLAKHYGLPAVKGEEFQRVALTGKHRQQRGGIITHASILTITSNPTRTSAVNRGNYVLENILGTPPPPPPDGVEIPPLEESGKGANQGKTLREQLELHREKPMCASCHERMDPIGFGLENFDAIGAWRDQEKGKPIDAAGELYTGEIFSGPAELRKILIEHKREAFVRCLSEKMLTYGLGRGLEYYDKPALGKIAKETAAKGFHFHDLIRAVVKSVPFQKRRGDRSGGGESKSD